MKEGQWSGYVLEVIKPQNVQKLIPNHPQIQFPYRSYSLGAIPAGATDSHPFVFMNSGRVPLFISQIESSCSCTASLLSATEILPHGTSTLLVTVSTDGQWGSHQQTITLTTNDPNEPSVSVDIFYNIEEPFSISTSHIAFGYLEPWRGATSEIILTGHSSRPFEIASVTSTIESLKISCRRRFTSTRLRDDLFRQVIEVGIDPSRLSSGAFEGFLYIKLTDLQIKTPILRVSGIKKTVPPLVPSSFYFGTLLKGTSKKKIIKISQQDVPSIMSGVWEGKEKMCSTTVVSNDVGGTFMELNFDAGDKTGLVKDEVESPWGTFVCYAYIDKKTSRP